MMPIAGGVAAMACDSSGLLASGSHNGVISLVPTGAQAAGTSMRLLPPHQRLLAADSAETFRADQAQDT